VKSKTAVCFNNHICRFGLAEHVAHRQVAPVEIRIPDHLPKPGQNDQMSTGIFQPHGLHAARVAKRRDGKIVICQ
jgi:hypothetical protein